MPGTPTTKYQIPTFAASGADPVNTGHTQINNALSTVDANMAGYTTGTLAARPAAGKAGLFYRCTDTGQVFVDIGSAWVELSRPSVDMGAYRPVVDVGMHFRSADTAGTYVQDSLKVGVSASVITAPFPITVADHAVTGLTTQFRIQALTMTNTTAPAINFTYSIAAVTTVAGGVDAFQIAAINNHGPSTVVRAAPAASGQFVDVSSDFTLTASTVYVLVVTTSGTPASGSDTQCVVRLQVHNI